MKTERTCASGADFSRSTAIAVALACVRLHFDLIDGVRLQSTNDHLGPHAVGNVQSGRRNVDQRLVEVAERDVVDAVSAYDAVRLAV